MKKLLAAVFAGLFALSVTAPVIAQDKDAKKEMKKGDGKKKDGKKGKKDEKK